MVAAGALTTGAAFMAATQARSAAPPRMSARIAARVSGAVGVELRAPTAAEQAAARVVGARSAARTARAARRAAARGVHRVQSNVTPSPGSIGCQTRLGPNVKENQNCVNVSDPDLLGRGQAQNETTIAADPNSPGHLVAGANDYRRGDGGCGYYYSRDGGTNWGDDLIPSGFVRGDSVGAARQYYTSFGDPTVAFDSSGNAFYVCQAFNRTAPTANEQNLSGFYLFRSPNGGASWTFPGRPIVESATRTGVDLEDKEMLAADANASSPFRDRLYVAWVEFRFIDPSDPNSLEVGQLEVSYSSDHGETWSAPQDISGSDAALCPNSITGGNLCDNNQFPQPFVGPDGSVYVVFQNFNNQPGRPVGDDGGGDGSKRVQAIDPNDNANQMLIVRSTDGGQTWSSQVRVAIFYDLPDCVTYTGLDAGRGCLPTTGANGTPGSSNAWFRAENYPSAVVDPTDPKHLMVTFGSYINGRSHEPACTPAGLNPDTGFNLYTGVGVSGGCNNDIVLAQSFDGGQTWGSSDPRALPSVNGDSGTGADQFWQWAGVTPQGRLVVSYYDRRYGDDQASGFMDVSIAGGRYDNSSFVSRRVTTGPMPPPTQFSGLFMGDYSGLAMAGGVAHPSWTDTRNVALATCTNDPTKVCPNGNDQDVFSAKVVAP
jgi:hypothetical protein